MIGVDLDFARLSHKRFVRVTDNERVRAVQNVTKPLVAVDRAARQDAAAGAVSNYECVRRVSRSVSVQLSDLDFDERDVLPIKPLKVELAHDVVGDVVVHVAVASFVVAGHGTEDFVAERFKHLHHDLFLLSRSHGFLEDVRHARPRSVVDKVAAEDDVAVRLVLYALTKQLPFSREVFSRAEVDVAYRVDFDVFSVWKMMLYDLKII